MKDKPKALLFLPYLAPYRVDVLNELGRYFDLTVVFQFANAPEQNFDQKLLRSKLKVDYIIFNKGINIGTRQIRFGLIKLLKSYQPDVVFSNEYGPTSLSLALLLKLKLFHFIHIATTSDNLSMAENAIYPRKTARKFVLNNAGGIVVYNDDIANWYEINFPKLAIGICPNIQNPQSVLSENSRELKQYIAEFKNKFELNNKRIILYVGRLHTVKGLVYLLEAFKKVASGNEKLVLVGDGPQKSLLKEKAEMLSLNNDIVFVGRYDGIMLHAWYQLADLFVLPSLHEPFGAVVNEALIHGLPVLCSKYAGAKYFINETNGWIFTPENPDEFKDKLQTAILKQDITRQQNLMIYDFNSSVREYQQVYNTLAVKNK